MYRYGHYGVALVCFAPLGGLLLAMSFEQLAVVGTVTIGAHLLADALTPMGVRPFAPVSDRTYTLGLTRADNPVANYGLLAAGIAVAGLAFAAGNAIASLVG
jgi:inner membrane protein